MAAVLAGEEVATSSLRLQYEDEGEPLPKAGQQLAVVDSSGANVAIVELLDVRVIRLGDADDQLALDEGEGFRSVAEWRAAHETFWRNEILPALRTSDGVSLDDDTEVVVEKFRVTDVSSA